MKWLVTACLLVMLTSCGANEELERAMDLRAQLLASGCSFEVEITADYGEEIHTFGMYCETDKEGNLGFRVTAPETISGITGRISAGEGELTFRDSVLSFPLLAEDQLSPVSGPWVFYTTLRSGYLTAAGMDADQLWLTIDDSYEEDALTVDVWLDGENLPVRGEILYDGRRILTLNVKNFQIL